MAQNIAFVHASKAARNIYERSTLLDEKIGNESLFSILLRSLKQSEKLDAVYIVTSDSTCDDWFCDIRRLSEIFADSRIKADVLRIPSDSPFAFSELNKKLDPQMLYQLPLYGLFSAEGFLELTKGLNVNSAIVINADSAVFISPDLIDILIERGAGEGDIASLLHPRRSIIAASPDQVHKLYRKRMSEIRASTSNRLGIMEKETQYLREFATGITDAEVGNLVRKKQKEINRQTLNSLEDLFYARNHEQRRKTIIKELNGREKCLLVIARERDLDLLRKINSSSEKAKLESLFRVQEEMMKEVKQIWPSYLNIELTNKCDCTCHGCPGPVLERKRGMMSQDLYRRIIDEVSENTPFVALSGYGEPTLHPELIDFVRYGKEKRIARMSVETNAVNLDGDTVAELFRSGLDFLIINVNAQIDFSPDWEKKLDGFIELRNVERERRGEWFPRIVLQMVNTNRMASRIDYVLAKYNFIADRIVIVPFDDFQGKVTDDSVIDFTPLKRTICKKILRTLYVYWDGSVGICGRFVNGEYPGMSLMNTTIRSVFDDDRMLNYYFKHLTRRYPDGCLNCKQWYLTDFSKEDPTSWLSLISSEFARRRRELIESIRMDGEKFYEEGKFLAAVDKWEKVLKIDPDNPSINEKLSTISQHKSPPLSTKGKDRN